MIDNTEKAKAYIRKRLSAEQSMSRNLEDALALAAKEIAKVLRKYNIIADNLDSISNQRAKREIERIIKKLFDELIDDVELLCESANEKDKDYILFYIHSAVYGITLRSRLNDWLDRFCNNIISLACNNGQIAITPSIDMGKGAEYGIDRLLRNTIAMAYMEEMKKENENAKGFIAYRGSSYPCPICQPYCDKGLQPMSAFQLPLHPNCVCYAVFIK